MITRDHFARLFLDRMGYPVRQRNLNALITLMQSEGGDARFNPLNTTKQMPGSTDYNSIGVQEYVSLEQGLEATVSTLKEHGHRYGPIRRRLRLNWFAKGTITAWGNSDWGTEITLALKVLNDVQRDYDSRAQMPIGQ